MLDLTLGRAKTSRSVVSLRCAIFSHGVSRGSESTDEKRLGPQGASHGYQNGTGSADQDRDRRVVVFHPLFTPRDLQSHIIIVIAMYGSVAALHALSGHATQMPARRRLSWHSSSSVAMRLLCNSAHIMLARVS